MDDITQLDLFLSHLRVFEFDFDRQMTPESQAQFNKFPRSMQMKMLALWRAYSEPLTMKIRVSGGISSYFRRWLEDGRAALAQFQLDVLSYQVGNKSDPISTIPVGIIRDGEVFALPYTAFRHKVLRMARNKL